MTLGHLAVGVLGDHDRSVDQHADRQDQAEQHDDVDGQPKGGERENSGQERPGDGNPDQSGRAQSERRDDHDHDQDDRAEHVVLQVGQHGADVGRLVLAIGDHDLRRPALARALDHGAHLFDGLDDVLAGALRHLERDRRPAVDPGEAFRVLEARPEGPDVADPHDCVGRHLDRHVENVPVGFEQPRQPDREASASGIHGTRGDHAVGTGHRVQDGGRIQVVAFDDQRIDDDFHDLVPIAGDLRLEDAGDALDVVLQIAREAEQGALRKVPGKRHHEHRKQAQVYFVDGRFVGVLGQFGLGQIHLLAQVGQRPVDVEAGLELEHDAGAAEERGRAHLLDALDVAQFLLHRFDEQALGVRRRDALVTEIHVEDRDLDVRVGLLGDGDVGIGAGDQDQYQGRHDRAGTADRRVDQGVHEPSPAGGASVASSIGRTLCPSVTKSWPTVISVTRSGRPLSQTPSGPSPMMRTG